MEMSVHVLKKMDKGPQAAAEVKRIAEAACATACKAIKGRAQELIEQDTGYGHDHIEVIGKHKVVANFPYALYLEQGTSPHWPPIEAVTPWAERHGIEPFLVAKSISEKGTPAKPFFKPACDAAKGVRLAAGHNIKL